MSFNFPGAAKLVRVPCVQNKAEGANLRLDLQPEDEGEGLEVGPRRSGLAPKPRGFRPESDAGYISPLANGAELGTVGIQEAFVDLLFRNAFGQIFETAKGS